MKNNLTLSSHEESLIKNYCNIFLDERTLAEAEKKNFNYIVSDSILFDNKDRLLSFKKCDKIYKSILSDLYLKLNDIHNIEWTKRSWEILIGFWLRKFIYIVFFKFNTLKGILNQRNIDRVCLSETKTGYLASHEATAIEDLSVDNDWSWILYSKIFKYLDTNKIEIKTFKNEKENFYEDKTLYEKLGKNISFKNQIVKSYTYLSKKFISKSSNFIAATYLPVLEEKKLQLLFGQIPNFYSPPKINYRPINLSLRKKLLIDKDCLEEEKIIRDLISYYLPTFALENFQILRATVEKHSYPRKPKFIFTSNLFESDEAFKFYLANITSKDNPPKYFVGQHGNSYFTKIDNNYSNEMITCDYFISWGNKNHNDKKIINLFNLKLPKKTTKKNLNKIVIIFRSLGYQTLPYDRWKEGQNEFLMIKIFLKYFDINFRKNIHLRLHSSFKNRYKKFVQNYLLDISDYEKDFGEISYKKVIDQAELVIFTYDSTGFLENLISGKPSICLYPNTFNHLNEDCNKYYKNLIDAKIIFDDPKEMYIHIKSIWPNVNTWWNSQKIQSEINNFSKIFSASVTKNPVGLIKKKITEKLI